MWHIVELKIHRKKILLLFFLNVSFYCIKLILAIDLQQCGISSEGALVIQEAIAFNKTLLVLDLRRNPQIGTQMHYAIFMHYGKYHKNI